MKIRMQVDQMYARQALKHAESLTPAHAAAEPDLGKRFSQAYDTPDGYPRLQQVSAESFRRGPVTAGEAAYSPAYEAPGWSVPVPSAVLGPGMIARPLLTDGHSRPCAPEAS